MRQEPRAHEVYQHFKGNLYQIITIANDSETLEQQVVYRQLYAPYEAYVRSLTMFLEEVDRVKYPEVEQQYRCELVEMKKETPVEHNQSKTTDNGLDPLFLQFFDEDTFAGKIKILEQMKSTVTNRMITSMAVATDITLNDTGEVEERYAELRRCLYTLEKFECNR